MTPLPPLAAGDGLAPGYEVIEHLRRGRALDVYDVWSEARGCRCVAKALRPDRAAQDGPRLRLLQEGRLLRALTHPHIVRGYETIDAPAPVVIMETLVGRTLGVLVEEAELAVEEVAFLGLHLASAVRYVHRHGYLHLDLKPSNVIAEAGRAKLIDLSVARAPGPAHAGIGTWYYMSPEQARGGELGPAADVWGLGAVLFEAVAGEPAFDDPEASEGSSWAEALASDEPYLDSRSSAELDEADYPQLAARARRVEELRPTAPAALGDLVAECLDPAPDRRPSLAALLERLESLAGLPEVERRHTRARAPAQPTR